MLFVYQFQAFLILTKMTRAMKIYSFSKFSLTVIYHHHITLQFHEMGFSGILKN